MGWWFVCSAGKVQFWWRIFWDKNIHSFHLCMISGNRDEAWPIYRVWPISERSILGWSGGMPPAFCHWLNTGMADGRSPIMFVLTQAYPCDTSTSVLPINMWSRCCNAYRDLWIMPIVSLLQSTCCCNVFPLIVFAPVHRRPTDRECHCYKLQGNRSTSPRITSRRLVDPGKLYRPAPGGDNCSL